MPLGSNVIFICWNATTSSSSIESQSCWSCSITVSTKVSDSTGIVHSLSRGSTPRRTFFELFKHSAHGVLSYTMGCQTEFIGQDGQQEVVWLMYYVVNLGSLTVQCLSQAMRSNRHISQPQTRHGEINLIIEQNAIHYRLVTQVKLWVPMKVN